MVLLQTLLPPDEDKKRGLVARLERGSEAEDARVTEVLGSFTRPWEWRP